MLHCLRLFSFVMHLPEEILLVVGEVDHHGGGVRGLWVLCSHITVTCWQSETPTGQEGQQDQTYFGISSLKQPTKEKVQIVLQKYGGRE